MITRPSFVPLVALCFIQKSVGSRLALAVLLIGGLTIWACGGEETTGLGQQQPSAPTVASVVVTPSTATLVSLGETTTLSAAATNSTGGTITEKRSRGVRRMQPLLL